MALSVLRGTPLMAEKPIAFRPSPATRELLERLRRELGEDGVSASYAEAIEYVVSSMTDRPSDARAAAAWRAGRGRAYKEAIRDVRIAMREASEP